MKKIIFFIIFIIAASLLVYFVGVWKGKLVNDKSKPLANIENEKNNASQISNLNLNDHEEFPVAKKMPSINEGAKESQARIKNREDLVLENMIADKDLKLLETYIDDIDYNALFEYMESVNQIKLKNDANNINSYYIWKDEGGLPLDFKPAFSGRDVGAVFSSEAREHNWASQREAEIASGVYKKLSELEASNQILDDVACKRSVCKLRIESANGRLAKDDLIDIANTVSVNNRVTVAPFSYQLQEDGGTVIYLSRYVPSLKTTESD